MSRNRVPRHQHSLKNDPFPELSRRSNARSVGGQVRDQPDKVARTQQESSFNYDFSQVPVREAFIPIIQQKNQTGLPNTLKAGIENLSGLYLDDVRVHYNSSEPAQLQALAYTQGTEIYVGPGQEQHLPHEAWHVVQQKQGRVKPTSQMKGLALNDNAMLEREADLMGARALSQNFTRDCGCASCSNIRGVRQAKAINQQCTKGCTCGSCSNTQSSTQLKQEPVQAKVIQKAKKCQVCNHKHGNDRCRVKVRGKECGCTSHSYKFDSGGKFNPGAGRRARFLDRVTKGGG